MTYIYKYIKKRNELTPKVSFFFVLSSYKFALMKSLKKGIRTIIAGVIINAILAITKIISGILGNSYALVADGIESTTDIFSSLIVWGGLKVSSRPADENHPYGHGKAESVSAFVVSAGLLGAAMVIVIQSIKEIVTPHLLPATFTLYVLGGVIIIKEILYRFVFIEGSKVNSTAMKADAWHHRSDAITSAAAFIGIFIALIGGKGYEMADDWAALVASGFIFFNGFRMMRFALHEIMDTVPGSEIEKKIRETAKNFDGVIEIEKCYIRKSGIDYIIEIHVVVDGNLTVAKGHEIGHKLKDHLLSSNLSIASVMVHVEPDKLNIRYDINHHT